MIMEPLAQYKPLQIESLNGCRESAYAYLHFHFYILISYLSLTGIEVPCIGQRYILHYAIK